MTIDEFKVVCDLTLELTKLKMGKVGHLCVENFAPEILEKLIKVHESVIKNVPKPATRVAQEWRMFVPHGTLAGEVYVKAPNDISVYSWQLRDGITEIRVREVLPE